MHGEDHSLHGEDNRLHGEEHRLYGEEHRLHSEDDVFGDLENKIYQEDKVNRKSKDKGTGGQEVDVKVNKNKEATTCSMSAADRDELAEFIARELIEK